MPDAILSLLKVLIHNPYEIFLSKVLLLPF